MREQMKFVELWGTPTLLLRWSLIALAVSVGYNVVQQRTIAGLAHANTNVRPLVIRIDDVGRAEAVSYDAATWTPQVAELRFALAHFTRLHFARFRSTVARDYSDSLLFLDEGVYGLGDDVESFVREPGRDERDVSVEHVRFSSLDAAPYKASVDFIVTDIGPNGQRGRATRYTADITFRLATSVPSAYHRVNPLGLLITRLRVDEEF